MIACLMSSISALVRRLRFIEQCLIKVLSRTHFKSSSESPNGPSAGLLYLRYVVRLPLLGLRIVAVSAVSAITSLPCSNQHKPVASYLDSLEYDGCGFAGGVWRPNKSALDQPSASA